MYIYTLFREVLLRNQNSREVLLRNQKYTFLEFLPKTISILSRELYLGIVQNQLINNFRFLLSFFEKFILHKSIKEKVTLVENYLVFGCPILMTISQKMTKTHFKSKSLVGWRKIHYVNWKTKSKKIIEKRLAFLLN